MPIPFREADLSFMFKDAGVPVTLGATSTYGLVRRAGQVLEQLGAAGVAGTEIILFIQTASMPSGFTVGGTVTIGASTYKVARRFELEDGAQTAMQLQEQP